MWLLKRQFEDDSLSEAVSHCPEMDPLQSLNSERIDNLWDLQQDLGN
jgi:hypothetical protein